MGRAAKLFVCMVSQPQQSCNRTAACVHSSSAMLRGMSCTGAKYKEEIYQAFEQMYPVLGQFRKGDVPAQGSGTSKASQPPSLVRSSYHSLQRLTSGCPFLCVLLALPWPPWKALFYLGVCAVVSVKRHLNPYLLGQWRPDNLWHTLRFACLAFHWPAYQCAMVTAGRQAAVCSCSACSCQSGRRRPQRYSGPSYRGPSCSLASFNRWGTSCSLASWQVTAACTATKLQQHLVHTPLQFAGCVCNWSSWR